MGSEISEFIQANPILGGRKVEQIRSFLQHKFKDELKSKKKICITPPKKRNSIPACIYSYFKENIERTKIVPDDNEIFKYYPYSPRLRKYLIPEIKELVEKAIQFHSEDNEI